jgi:hypothetical protein
MINWEKVWRDMATNAMANNDTLNDNLTATQARCNELLEENRKLRATVGGVCPRCGTHAWPLDPPTQSTQALADHDHGGQTRRTDAAGEFVDDSIGDFGLEDPSRVWSDAELLELQGLIKGFEIGRQSPTSASLNELRRLKELCARDVDDELTLRGAIDIMAKKIEKLQAELDEINAHHEWLASDPDGAP